MAYIDPNASLPRAVPDGVASARAEQQRGGWLRALESSGWHDILAGMRNFPGASPFEPSAGDLAESTNRAAAEGLDEGSSPTNALSAGVAATMSESGEGKIPAVPGGGGNPMPAPDGMPWGGASYRPVVTMSNEEEGLSGTAAPSGLIARDPAVQPPAQKVMILQTSGNGVEVWVRDAGMSHVQMQLMLSDMRRNIRNQGSELTRMSLNGHQVYANRPVGGEHEDKRGD